MQTISLSWKGKPIRAFRFFGISLVVMIVLQSCASMLEGSFDNSKLRYSGESYNNPSPSDGDFGINFMIMLLSGLGQQPDISTSQGNFNPYRSQYASALLASHLTLDPAYTNDNNLSNKKQKQSGFSDHMRFMGGLEFIQKKSKDGNTKNTLNYLEVPIYALYQTDLGTGGNVFGGLGPYVAYGVGGKLKSTSGGQTNKTKSFDKTTGFKPFDAGLTLTAGYRIPNSFSFRLAYDLGLADIGRNDFDKVVNRTISLNIGYPLDKITKRK